MHTAGSFFVLLFLVLVLFFIITAGYVFGKVVRGVFYLLANIVTLGQYSRRPVGQTNAPRPNAFGTNGFASFPTSQPPQHPGEPSMFCQTPGCYRENPVSARFCRHCGQQFPMQHRI